MSPIATSSPSILGSSYLNFTGSQPSSSFTGIAGPRRLSMEEQTKRYRDKTAAKLLGEAAGQAEFRKSDPLFKIQDEVIMQQRQLEADKLSKERDRYNAMSPAARSVYNSPQQQYARGMQERERQLAEQKSAYNAYQNNKTNWGRL
jgi:hypothetical protein